MGMAQVPLLLLLLVGRGWQTWQSNYQTPQMPETINQPFYMASGGRRAGKDLARRRGWLAISERVCTLLFEHVYRTNNVIINTRPTRLLSTPSSCPSSFPSSLSLSIS